MITKMDACVVLLAPSALMTFLGDISFFFWGPEGPVSAGVFHHIAVTCFLTWGPREGPPTCLHTLIIARADGTCKVCIITTTATTAAISALLVCESEGRATLLFQEG